LTCHLLRVAETYYGSYWRLGMIGSQVSNGILLIGVAKIEMYITLRLRDADTFSVEVFFDFSSDIPKFAQTIGPFVPGRDDENNRGLAC